VTEESPKNIFFKGKYTDTNVLALYRKNPKLFDNISRDSATFEYVSVIKELVDSNPTVVKNSLFLNSEDDWSGVYERDTKNRYFDEVLWRSTDKQYIIFWNSSSWIVTYSKYEKEISKTCGGVASYSSLDEFM
jgi:hypothetical protein